MREFDQETLGLWTAHEECDFCTECLLMAFRSFKFTVAETVSTFFEDHFGEVSVHGYGE
jgi:hypothetical protein